MLRVYPVDLAQGSGLAVEDGGCRLALRLYDLAGLIVIDHVHERQGSARPLGEQRHTPYRPVRSG
jgi:hypothetical protein